MLPCSSTPQTQAALICTKDKQTHIIPFHAPSMLWISTPTTLASLPGRASGMAQAVASYHCLVTLTASLSTASKGGRGGFPKSLVPVLCGDLEEHFHSPEGPCDHIALGYGKLPESYCTRTQQWPTGAKAFLDAMFLHS